MPDQNPPATDFILHVNVPCAGGAPAYLEIRQAARRPLLGYAGTLFEHQEVCPTGDLETWVRQANAMAGRRSFDDVVLAFPGERHT